jgi:hypothetical protein
LNVVNPAQTSARYTKPNPSQSALKGMMNTLKSLENEKLTLLEAPDTEERQFELDLVNKNIATV